MHRHREPCEIERMNSEAMMVAARQYRDGIFVQGDQLAYPVDQAVLHVVCGINGSLAGDELQEHDAEGEHVRLVRELAARRVLRGQVPAQPGGQPSRAVSPNWLQCSTLLTRKFP